MLDVLRSGLADDGAADGGVRGARSRSTSASATRSPSPSCTAALHLAYLAAGVGPGDEVIVPAHDVRRHRGGGRSTAARRRCSPTSPGRTTSRWTRATSRRRISPRTKAVAWCTSPATRRRVERAARAVRRPRARADRGRRARARAPPSTAARSARSASPGAFSFFSNKVLACGEGGLLATDDDEVAALARSLRSQGMTSGTWSRHTGETETYDAVGLGFNYRLDEPRAALLHVAAGALGCRHRRTPPGADPRATASALGGLDGADACPYARRGRRALLVLRDARAARRRPRAATTCAAHLREQRRSRRASSIPRCTSSPPTASASARRAAAHGAASRAAEITLPLYPHMTRPSRTASSTRSPRRCA